MITYKSNGETTKVYVNGVVIALLDKYGKLIK